MGGGGSSKQTVGYKYFAGLHLVFCNKIDELLQIRVQDKKAWTGDITTNTAVSINKPELFGGEEKEGGVKGTVDICFGEYDQAPNPYLQSVLGSAIPAFRGLFALVARRCYVAANNPYLKPWSILARRTSVGWEEAHSTITAPDGFEDMNPAHIIYETLTNTEWGTMGYPVADLDLDAFRAAAVQLHAEGFGMSIVWSKDGSAEDFIQTILDHIDAVLFFSHDTGKTKLKLVRNDYNVGSMLRIDESNIIELVEYNGPNDTEIYNQIVINYVDRENVDRSVTLHDIAGIARMNGQINSNIMDFPGISNKELAVKVASRELQQLSRPISSVVCVVNRTASGVEPGDVLNFSWGPLGIQDMSMRVTEVEYDVHSDQKLRITAVRDVYGLNEVSFVEPTDSLWTNPESEPADALDVLVTEATYMQLVYEIGEEDASAYDPATEATHIVAMCARPSSDAINYDMYSKLSGATEYIYRDRGYYEWVSKIQSAVIPELQTTLDLLDTIDEGLIYIGAYAYLGTDEIVSVASLDIELNQITINRGVLDTIPIDHPADTALIFSHQRLSFDSEERAPGEIVDVKLLPRTGLGTLALVDATNYQHTCTGRMLRPYPPGNVQIEGSRWPAELSDEIELVITWAHRDRIAQTDSIHTQDEGNIGPETGVTYTLRIYGETDTLLRTETGLTGTSYTYAEADEKADSGLPGDRWNTSLRIELESVNSDGISSLYKWNLTVIRPVKPVNVVAPTISGTDTVGSVLIVDEGTWELAE